jgi:hypothetical protein
MELSLDEKEVKNVLLDYVNSRLPVSPPFNTVKLRVSYSSLSGADFTYETPEPEEL